MLPLAAFMRRAWLVWLLFLAAAPAQARTLLVVGDSLSAAYGLAVDAGWVALLENRLRAEQLDYKVINASISGDTTANGLARLPQLLKEHRPDIVIIELGGNDGLRGLPLDQMRRNLSAMAAKAKAAGARVLLVGVELPPNYGRRYTDGFRRAYADAAREQRVALAPSFLAGIGANPELMQRDQIHPNAGAQQRMLENVWPQLRPLL
jgi:acyl-CoA thioesterase-1